MKIPPEERIRALSNFASYEAEADNRLRAALEAYDSGDEGAPAEVVFRRLDDKAAVRKGAKKRH